MRIAGILACLLLLPTALVHAEGGVDYGPVPEALASIQPEGGDRALADAALAMLRERRDLATARRQLVLLGDAGLAVAARRLADGGLGDDEQRELLAVVAASSHPAAEEILDRAGHEARPLYRAMAAHGLGVVREGGAPLPLALARLAGDPVPTVRIAALRSLFARGDGSAARSLRIGLPADPVPALLAKRLAWHRRAGDAAPALLAMARSAYRDGKSVALRMAAADYLTLPEAGAPIPLLEMVLAEMGGGPPAAWIVRLAREAPQAGYDEVAMRALAVRAVLTLVEHPDATPAQRADWLRWAVGFVAKPVPMDPYEDDPIPEYVLRRRLPDFGEAIVPPTMAMLRRGAFDDPRQGMVLLRELGAEVALPLVRSFLQPRVEAPRYESRAEASRRGYLRSAAAGVLQELGRVGDEALARALLFGDEPMSVKGEIVRALAGDDGTWAVPLLVELMTWKIEYPSGEVRYPLRQDAILALEERSEPEARAALVEDLFERAERPHDRLRHLVRRGDEEALAVMKRALEDERRMLRRAGLSQFHRRRNPRLCRTGADLVRAYKPDFGSRPDIQAFLYALISVAPAEAVAFVDEQWDALPTDDARAYSLRMLREVVGEDARAAAIDLALRRTPVQGAPRPLALAAAAVFHGQPGAHYDWKTRVEAVGPYFEAWLHAEDQFLQETALHAWGHPDAPPATGRLLELLARARAGEALPPESSTHAGEQEFAENVLTALTSQPWEDVEEAFVDVALDASGDIDLAIQAAWRLVGRIGEPTRERLFTWLDFDEQPDPEAPARKAHHNLQLFLAAAVGTGADATMAARLHRTLARELWTFFDPEWMRRIVADGPQALHAELQKVSEHTERTRAFDLYTRVGALARAVASTRHEESILATISLVFDPRLAVFARECVRREARYLRQATAGAAAIEPSDLNALGHMDAGSMHWGMPVAVYEILREAKVVSDEHLAEAMQRALSAARADGRLARFPTLYLLRALESQLEPHTGRMPLTADVIWRHATADGEADTPVQFWLRRKQSTQLADTRRFAEAARAQARAVRILVRGNHADRGTDFLARERAVMLALRAAADAVSEDENQPDIAGMRFDEALAEAPQHPDTLNTVAWYRAMSGHGLEAAEREARRATLLEARTDSRPSANAADTLAYVLLLRDKAREGLSVLAPRMGERAAAQNGLLHYHVAQLHAAVGNLRAARDALIRALVWDRALEVDVPGDAHLAPLLEKLPLERIRALASATRLEYQLRP